ncbi:hypothetical protein FB567DRAFT_540773, partial [Paraphoma chrysanthemicola]
MGKSLQKIASCVVHLLLAQSTLPSLVQADTNGSFVDQSAFSQFELWKNTGLQPCPINTTATLSAVNATSTARERIVARDPRGGGRGGGSSSSGGSSGGTNGGDFIKSTWVDKQDSFCQKMKGTPIMIPSKPTQYGFTPWWPTFTAQFVSLVFTWVGLWWTTRTVEREGAQDMKLPISFWIQLPIDVARMLAWFVKTFHGFAVANRFSWVSVILWLVPFNYIWLVRLLDAKKRTSTQAVLHSTPQPTPYGQAADYYKVPHVEEANTTQTTSGPTRWFFLSILFAAITAFMWILSLVVVGLHFKYAWFDSKHTHPIYVEVAKAVSDPALIARGVPEACINWAKRVPNTIAWDLLDLRIVQAVQVLIVAIQFVMCTAV